MRYSRRKYFARISYKRFIVMAALGLILIMLLLFSVYSFFDYQYKRDSNAKREASVRIAQIVKSFCDKTDYLLSYYITAIESESVNWLIENDISYSDYSRYVKAYSTLDKNRQDTAGFALINYKTGWVLSNKGLFTVDDITNKDTLEAYFERGNKKAPKYDWLYVEFPDAIASENREYHFSIDTQGLNLVLELPLNSFSEYARLVVNISPKKLGDWFAPWLNEYEDILVLNEERKVIYASDEWMLDECIRMTEEGIRISNPLSKKDGGEKRTYVIALQKAESFRNWNFFIAQDVNKGGLTEENFSGIWYIMNIILLFLAFLSVVITIYHPVGVLAKDVAKNDGSEIEGNEIHFLSDKFRNLRKDKSALEEIVFWQRAHLEELFELRLLRGEVAEGEWKDFMEEFHRTPKKYFVSTVLVLDLYDKTEDQNSLNEEAVCLKILEKLPDKMQGLPWLPPVCHLGTIYCLLADDREETLQEKIRDFYNGMGEFIEKEYDIRIRMGISSVHTNYSHVHNSYRESVNALLTQNITDIRENSLQENANKCFYYISDLATDKDPVGNKYDPSYEKRIQRSIRSMDWQESCQITDEFFEYLRGVQASSEQIRVCILNYVNAIFMVTFQMKVYAEEKYRSISDIYYGVLEGMELARICSDIKQKLLDSIFEERKQYINDTSGSLAENVYRLIDQHKGNLTLYECAELLEVDPNYVWKALKLVSDKSFSDIVEEYKLEEAKRLLLQTDMKINDIAAELNYSNTQNFIRFFSKCTGLTPGKFRRLY